MPGCTMAKTHADRSAPVVSHQRESPVAQVLGQRADVLDELRDGVLVQSVGRDERLYPRMSGATAR